MKSLLKVAFFAFLGLMVLGTLLGEKKEGASDAANRPSVTASGRGFSNTAGAQQAAGRSSPELEVLSWKCEKDYDYVFVRGEVRNLSGKKLENVMAVGTFRTSDGTLVKIADSLLDYDPLMPGQTSPFSAGTTDNPEITKCDLSFKHLFGTRIDHTVREARQQGASERERVAEAQRLLKKHGYDPGPADGVAGAHTEAAVRAFRRDRNLGENGRINETLLLELRK